eukprot:scaffold18679_cov59-Phaeocystis_antarctica.AAC.3
MHRVHALRVQLAERRALPLGDDAARLGRRGDRCRHLTGDVSRLHLRRDGAVLEVEEAERVCGGAEGALGAEDVAQQVGGAALVQVVGAARPEGVALVLGDVGVRDAAVALGGVPDQLHLRVRGRALRRVALAYSLLGRAEELPPLLLDRRRRGRRRAGAALLDARLGRGVGVGAGAAGRRRRRRRAPRLARRHAALQAGEGGGTAALHRLLDALVDPIELLADGLGGDQQPPEQARLGAARRKPRSFRRAARPQRAVAALPGQLGRGGRALLRSLGGLVEPREAAAEVVLIIEGLRLGVGQGVGQRRPRR